MWIYNGNWTSPCQAISCSSECNCRLLQQVQGWGRQTLGWKEKVIYLPLHIVYRNVKDGGEMEDGWRGDGGEMARKLEWDMG